jgi:hypothetical protein
MPWKKKDNVFEVDAAGNPIWIDSAAKEAGVDGDVITRLNGEAATHRKDKEAAQKALKDFEGIDPVAAREAISKLATVDLSKMVEIGKVDEMRAAVGKEYQTKLDAEKKVNADLTAMHNKTLVDMAFAASPFVRDKFNVPTDMLKATFGDSFTVQDGKVIAKDAAGNPISSVKKMGEVADFEEAFEVLVNQYPHKATILKGVNNGGTGNNGDGGNQQISKTLTRAEFDKLEPAAAAAFSVEVRAKTAQLIDNP